MKKKVLSLCMAAALVLGSGTAAMADTLTSKGDSIRKNETGKYIISKYKRKYNNYLDSKNKVII